MKGITSLLVATLFLYTQGVPLEKSEWETALGKLREENGLKKEEILPYPRTLNDAEDTPKVDYKQLFLKKFNHRNHKNDNTDTGKWKLPIPSDVLLRLKSGDSSIPRKNSDRIKNDHRTDLKKENSDEGSDGNSDEHVPIEKNYDLKDSSGEKAHKKDRHAKRSARRKDSDEDTNENSDDNDNDTSNSNVKKSHESHRRRNSNGRNHCEQNSQENDSDEDSNEDSDDNDSDKSDSNDKKSHESHRRRNSDRRNHRKQNSKENDSDEETMEDSGDNDSNEDSDDNDSNKSDSNDKKSHESHRRKNSNRRSHRKRNSKENDSDEDSNDSDSNETNASDNEPCSEDSDEDDSSNDKSSNRRKQQEIKEFYLNLRNQHKINEPPAPWNWKIKPNGVQEFKENQWKKHLEHILQIQGKRTEIERKIEDVKNQGNVLLANLYANRWKKQERDKYLIQKKMDDISKHILKSERNLAVQKIMDICNIRADMDTYVKIQLLKECRRNNILAWKNIINDSSLIKPKPSNGEWKGPIEREKTTVDNYIKLLEILTKLNKEKLNEEAILAILLHGIDDVLRQRNNSTNTESPVNSDSTVSASTSNSNETSSNGVDSATDPVTRPGTYSDNSKDNGITEGTSNNGTTEAADDDSLGKGDEAYNDKNQQSDSQGSKTTSANDQKVESQTDENVSTNGGSKSGDQDLATEGHVTEDISNSGKTETAGGDLLDNKASNNENQQSTSSTSDTVTSRDDQEVESQIDQNISTNGESKVIGGGPATEAYTAEVTSNDWTTEAAGGDSLDNTDKVSSNENHQSDSPASEIATSGDDEKVESQTDENVSTVEGSKVIGEGPGTEVNVAADTLNNGISEAAGGDSLNNTDKVSSNENHQSDSPASEIATSGDDEKVESQTDENVSTVEGSKVIGEGLGTEVNAAEDTLNNGTSEAAGGDSLNNTDKVSSNENHQSDSLSSEIPTSGDDQTVESQTDETVSTNEGSEVIDEGPGAEVNVAADTLNNGTSEAASGDSLNNTDKVSSNENHQSDSLSSEIPTSGDDQTVESQTDETVSTNEGSEVIDEGPGAEVNVAADTLNNGTSEAASGDSLNNTDKVSSNENHQSDSLSSEIATSGDEQKVESQTDENVSTTEELENEIWSSTKGESPAEDTSSNENATSKTDNSLNNGNKSSENKENDSSSNTGKPSILDKDQRSKSVSANEEEDNETTNSNTEEASTESSIGKSNIEEVAIELNNSGNSSKNPSNDGNEESSSRVDSPSLTGDDRTEKSETNEPIAEVITETTEKSTALGMSESSTDTIGAIAVTTEVMNPLDGSDMSSNDIDVQGDLNTEQDIALGVETGEQEKQIQNSTSQGDSDRKR
ncbi:PREDICTED: uncharacterized protein DDB_G0283357-like [Dufourea novaeangliae]|uniref:uncharacterized protein DDB_G0283357-like n=1 Tax=Dufourea novaeangliae TaxID=178035 RepID=UPI000767674A|nr:PREDICTED: uncharacterized protein DDB_G0283357-like [Dufourea novaeangliae]